MVLGVSMCLREVADKGDMLFLVPKQMLLTDWVFPMEQENKEPP